jgi:hypothetical protein
MSQSIWALVQRQDIFRGRPDKHFSRNIPCICGDGPAGEIPNLFWGHAGASKDVKKRYCCPICPPQKHFSPVRAEGWSDLLQEGARLTHHNDQKI